AMLGVYGLGRQTGGRDAARLSTVALAAHPVFVTQAIQPMSDVPATAWLVLAVALLAWRRPVPLAAGICAALALWTRPPLMLAALLAGMLPVRSVTRRDRILYLTVVVVSIGALVVLQGYLYGTPLTSGRGSASALFRLERLWPNIVNYGWSFTLVHT